MVSKNNQWQHLQVSAQRVPHYGLRKLSVGVASVLLSTTLYMGVSAHADTVTTPSETSTPATTATTPSPMPTGMTGGTAKSSNSGTPSNSVSETPTGQGTPEKSAAGSGSADSNGATPVQPAATAAPTAKPGAGDETPKAGNEMPASNVTQKETVDSQWIIHYVNQADHKQELKDPTVITLQYTRTNTSQSDGTTKYGDWSYVPGSYKQTGTPITVNDSNNPVKQDNVDKDGENMDAFTITAMYPTITGYTMHNNINGTRLHDYLRNNDRQADTMSKDFYAEYDVAKERSVSVKFVDDQSFDPNVSGGKAQVGQAITLTGRDGDTVKVNVTVPDKYQLANGQQLPTTYTFTAGSGDVTIHLVHKVVQREAAVNVQLMIMTGVDIEGVDGTRETITQEQWGQLGDDFSVGTPGALFEALPSVEVGTLTGHINYDLVDNEVISFGDDWTTLNLGGRTYQLPNGTDVVNGVLTDSDDGSLGKPLREYYLKHYSIVNPGHSVDPDYSTRPWYGYLSVNETNDPNSPLTQWNDLGLQGGLAGNEPNTLAKANGDQAATSVEMANKTIEASVLNPDIFREQDGRLQATLPVPVVGVYVPYVEKTATRTINVTNPDGKTIAVKQTATLAKQVDFGKDAHPAWTTGEWANYDVPTIPGYTASQSNVAEEAVTGTTKDQTVNITYTANPQTTTVVYQTEDGTPVYTTAVKGQTGQTVKVSNEVPAGWVIINGKVPSEITFGANGTPKTVVTIAHQRVTVDPDHPQNNGTKLSDNPSKTFSGVEVNDLNKTITRTIKVTTPDGKTTTTKQTAKLTRNADVDEVTGEVTYGNWTTGEWAAYDAPSVAGYTPSQTTVAKESVTATLKDTTVEISYLPMQHQISVEYVDDDDHGKVVKTDQVPGKTDQTIKVTPSAPANYNLVDNGNRTYTVNSDDAQTVQIHVKHYQVTTSESKNVTRTIDVHTPHDGTKVVKQTVKLTRNVTTDQVTGEKAYGDWSATDWDRYVVPAVAGYVPSIEQVAQQVVNGTTTDQTIDVTYSSGEHTTHINYVDGDGNIVHTTTIKGQTDGTVQVPNETPAGWTVVGEPVPTELAFGPDGHADVTVTVAHQHVTVAPDQPKTPTDKFLDNPAKTYPNGVGHDDLNKTITRTIKITTPDGQTKTVEQTAKLTRTANVDEVTGAVAYGNWTTGEWLSYDVPTVPGYTASQNEVPAVNVTDGIKDQTVTVTYTANDQTTHINYVDGNGKIVHTTTVTGKTDQTVKVPNEVPVGWTITGGQVPSEVTFGANGYGDVTVTVDHQHVTVTPDRPRTDGTKLPGNPSQTFHGVAEADLNKVVTRTIEVTTPAGKTDTITQTVKLTRTATVDEVTGEVTYGAWSTGNWDAYRVPALKGYTANQTTVAATPVTSDTSSQTVKITYTADQGTVYVTYVDEAGHSIHTTTVTGTTGQTVKVPKEVPAGWVITKGDVPTTVAVNGDETQMITITVQHRTVTVESNQPQPDGTPLPDNPSQHFTGVESGDLNKTITRTIVFNVPGQDPQTVTQTAKLTRTATVDEVTGTVTYGDWTTAKWPALTVPVVDGYTASQSQIPAVTVEPATNNQTVTVDYQAVEVPTTSTTTSEALPTAASHTSGTKPMEMPTTHAKVASSGASATPVPSAAKTSQLPQTGVDKVVSTIMTSLGLLMGALSAFVLGRKQKGKGRKD